LDGLQIGKLSQYITMHPGPTQPGHPFVGSCSEYQQKLGSKQAYCTMQAISGLCSVNWCLTKRS